MRSLVERGWVQAIWKNAKQWRHIPVGPVQFTYKLGRRYEDRQFAKFQTVAKTHRTVNGSNAARAVGASSPSPHSTLLQTNRGAAVVVGAGPGLGEALAKLLARKGFPVALVSRSETPLEKLARHLRLSGVQARAYPCDVTDERSVIKLMQEIEMSLGTPELVVYAIQTSHPGSLITTEACAFEEAWRGNCFGAFLVAREAARKMQPFGRGTILFAGATSGTVGRQGYINLAVGKFGLRALSQVIARELGPQGIHVAHVVIDGDIAEDPQSGIEPQIQPDELADLFWSLHTQPRSCWTSEIDVRPAEEAFWEHC